MTQSSSSEIRFPRPTEHSARFYSPSCEDARAIFAPLRTDLLRLQVADDGVNVIEDLVDEGHDLPDLHLNKMPPAFLGNLDERVACHVLHAVMRLCGTKKSGERLTALLLCRKASCEVTRSLTVHELEELVDNCLEELPVGTQEPWVLPYNVHDVGGDDGLVVFPSFLLTQPQQVLKCTHTHAQIKSHLPAQKRTD